MNRSEATRPADLAGDAEPSDLLERAFARNQHELLGLLYYLAATPRTLATHSRKPSSSAGGVGRACRR